MQLLHYKPRLSLEWAANFAKEHFALAGSMPTELPSERDQNFFFTDVNGDRFVLKVFNAQEEPAFLDAQEKVLERLAQTFTTCPRVVASRSGKTLFAVAAPSGHRHCVRLVSFLAGVPLARVRRQSPELLRDLGKRLGMMDRVLADFDHPACHRDFHWDLANASRTISQHVNLIADAELRTAVDRLLERFEQHAKPLLGCLRRSVIHGDANDYNVLVDDGPDLATMHQRVVGIIDFGDLVHSYTVGNLAVAAAYTMLDKSDPLAAAAQVVEGYHREFPLNESEIAVLFGLIGARLALSACLAAWQHEQQPDDNYLTVSQAPLRRTLPRLLAIQPRFVEAVFRESCGLIPAPTSAAVNRWLRDNAASMKPVLDVDLRTSPCLVLDLSIASPLIQGDLSSNTEPELTARVFGAMKEAGVKVGVGRYDEPRLIYTSPLFTGDTSPLAQSRTIHLGMDLFAPVGTPIHAPLAGVVHILANNAAALDYGPVVILRHQTDDGIAFYTLYGHLGLEVLSSLRVGQTIAAGERIASIGEPAVNGGWTPHLHLQIITDLLDFDKDYPGVASPGARDDASPNMRAVWISFSPDPNLLVGIPKERFPELDPTSSQTLAVRRRRLGRNLSVAYQKPVKIVRGFMQFLYDDEGRRYLDAYNNVPHVGHCHPRVVEAGQRQMAVLNTNTRYLHDLINKHAEQLTATLPAPLSVCYFLNSASEANELALRLARAHTGRRDVIVLDAAYHGHTNALIDISPYKHSGPGGTGAPEWVHVAPIPDGYRGVYKYADPNAGEKYANHVRDAIAALQRSGGGPGAFIAETCPSVGGQIMLPDGYLVAVYSDVHAAGGLCIADEVQTGLGRLGTHFWAFAAHGVVPDIVVMGKPLGNGHPLAAIVTTPAVAASFDNGMEFFSTFGGNPVSCAVGLTVLQVMRDERLQEHALAVGQQMLDGLRSLMERHPLIGDVRGSGLFLGVELVRDRQSLEPAAPEAALIVNRMRESGILMGTDGPFHNVIKIRPPMPFSQEDGELLVAKLDGVLTVEFEG